SSPVPNPNPNPTPPPRPLPPPLALLSGRSIRVPRVRGTSAVKFLRPDLRFLDALAGSRLPWRWKIIHQAMAIVLKGYHAHCL
ncbi:unnamed protein product, partial [Musa banksii]